MTTPTAADASKATGGAVPLRQRKVKWDAWQAAAIGAAPREFGRACASDLITLAHKLEAKGTRRPARGTTVIDDGCPALPSPEIASMTLDGNGMATFTLHPAGDGTATPNADVPPIVPPVKAWADSQQFALQCSGCARSLRRPRHAWWVPHAWYPLCDSCANSYFACTH